jgi:beta-fructofuranosidase
MFATGLLTGIFSSGVMAQDVSTTMTAPLPGVTPTGDYSGKYRPQVHFSPPTVSASVQGEWYQADRQGFMNDPNGMFVDEEGIWHLYYQCESPHESK